MDDLENIEWHALELKSVFQKIQSSDKGLDVDESKNRLKKYGFNILHTKKTETIPRILLRQLCNPIVYVSLFSTFLAFVLGKITDGFVVFGVVVLNTIIGFFQEYRANRIVKALSEMIPHETMVIRHGNQKLIPASQVVPGDIVFLQAGDKVPADMRLFYVKNLECDESILTGEPFPVSKNVTTVLPKTLIAERKCIAFSGTYVTSGTGYGVIIATGLKTEFGKISESIQEIQHIETPLSVSLKKIAAWITCGVLVSGVSLFIVGSLRGSSIFDAAFSAVTLAVAAIPEGLPAIITITSAIGVRRMARRQAIVRQLPTVEALGSTSVICTDKTGTLTRNEMTVQRLWTDSGFSFVTGVGFVLEGQIIPSAEKKPKNMVLEEEIAPLLTAVIVCSDATVDHTASELKIVGDPTEVALVIAGRKLQMNEHLLRCEWRREDIIPFEPERRLMATLNTSSKNKQCIFIKGAPEEILHICRIDEMKKKELFHQIDEMAKEGMRILAVAEKEVNHFLSTIGDQDIRSEFRFLGLIGMVDPPRKEVYKAINACYAAGISIKMVTGDHPVTAKSIGQELGLFTEGSSVISGAELQLLNTEEWKDVALKNNIFARVSPEHKLKLVESLQNSGHVVAMTGDGVNDAPALKRADIGIAMGVKGTSVAKEAADMILVDDNFASIEAAVEEGRRVYDNLIKSLVFILPTSLGQALVILIAVLFFPMINGALLYPMLPIQILWINLVVAVALALPLAFEAQEPDIMQRPPRKKNAPVLNRFVFIRTLIVSVLMAAGAVGLFLWEYHRENAKGTVEQIAISEAQTMAVGAIMLFQVFYLFHCRSLRLSILKINFFSNFFIVIGVGVVLLAQIVFTYTHFMNHIFHTSSLNSEAWLISIGVALIMFLITMPFCRK